MPPNAKNTSSNLNETPRKTWFTLGGICGVLLFLFLLFDTTHYAIKDYTPSIPIADLLFELAHFGMVFFITLAFKNRPLLIALATGCLNTNLEIALNPLVRIDDLYPKLGLVEDISLYASYLSGFFFFWDFFTSYGISLIPARLTLPPNKYSFGSGSNLLLSK